MRQKGYILPILIIAILLVVTALGGLFYYRLTHLKPKEPGNSLSTIPTSTPVLTKQSTSTQIDETANWKTYTNKKYKYSFRFPADLEVVNGAQEDYDLENTASIGVQRLAPAFGNIFGLNTNEINGQLSEIEVDYRKDKNNTNFSKINIDGVSGVSFLYYGGLKRIEFVNNGILYDFNDDIYNNDFNTTDEKTFDQILSTFKFLN